MSNELENIYNLFVFLEGDDAKELGVVCHQYAGGDSEKTTYLQLHMKTDLGNAQKFSLPYEELRIWLNLDSDQSFSFKMLSYFIRIGHVLRLFESVFKEINAPKQPLTCITLVQDGVPRVDAVSDLDPTVSGGELLIEEFGGQIRKYDYLGKYAIAGQLDLNALLEDDFLQAIKLLYEAKCYVSAMKLILSFIDTLSYLEYGDERGVFKKWISTYADLEPIGVSASQIWELRCGLLHMTNYFSRGVLKGNEKPLCFYSDPDNQTVFQKGDDSVAMFSFEGFYDSIIQAIGNWSTPYSGNLEKQLKFIARYDQVLSEGRIASLYTGVTGEIGR